MAAAKAQAADSGHSIKLKRNAFRFKIVSFRRCITTQLRENEDAAQQSRSNPNSHFAQCNHYAMASLTGG